ncbi:MAG: 1-(5-phosphoribosyl)-5-amino-4-imidazole-carboxylate carboxylase [Deltaproteobacteria bacterium RBG_13_65_10]|nr:MAG: 1-(5-phosphoribosyl)-5-amino-4-imidazole-carboxylate carboxylase [Deltaproteobacteria bacterium RBG_13_65_10]
MDRERLRRLLDDVRLGRVSVEKAVERLRSLPYEDLGFAKIDHHRALRKGFPEVILGEGKSAAQIVAILRRMKLHSSNVLVTRVDSEKAARVRRAVPGLRHDAVARTLVLLREKIPPQGRGAIAIVTAGTSDVPVAEEAAVTAALLGHEVERIYDVGVAGVHRVFDSLDRLLGASVIIVCAGMEGALASVIGGLVDRPVIAVPTSVGYGASFGGIAALLGMLNTCAQGVTVVNIDNGFGAAFAAALINRKA